MAKLHDRLALAHYVGTLLGDDPDGLAAALRDTDEGQGPDGHSHFYGVLAARNGRLGDGELARYDAQILAHERALGAHRPGFRLRYFQYLAALHAEIVLERLAHEPGRLLQDVEAHRAAHFPDLPPFEPATLRTLAFRLATGAGKTLLLHVHLRQALHHFPGRFQNVLLVVPTETLREQHLAELRQSGFRAAFAAAPDAALADVQVIEITKLYVEGETARPRGAGAVSLPTSEFEGPVLLLVDEGHKGTKTATDQKDERTWRAIREALAGAGGPAAAAGLTLEYSATFAQVTEGTAPDARQLFDDYARQTVYEYAYRRFHGDGFGKDYRAINVAGADAYGDRLLLGALLTLYEKQRLFDTTPEAASVFQEAPPLMAFVSSRVTGGDELVGVLRFLDRVLREPAWATEGVAALLRAESGLPGPDGRDAFAVAFPSLRALGESAADVYADLCRRLFYGHGPLVLVPLADAPGEIGLRTADAARDRFFGVINVGDAPALRKKVEAETAIAVSDETPFTGSLFAGIGDDASPLRLLVGAKKFAEGWSTPRLSVMGLMSVGTSAGAQVLQLFGRGVRLRGLGGQMRRADTLPGVHPPLYLDRLETLDVFGIKANYLKEFLDALRREGAEVPILRTLPLFADAGVFERAGLQTLRVEAGYDFADAETLDFDPNAIRAVALDLTPKVTTGAADGTATATAGLVALPLSGATRALLDVDALHAHALAHKQTKGWHNLQIRREAIARALESKARLAARDEVLTPSSPAFARLLDAAARTLVEKAIDAFYRGAQERALKSRLVRYPLRVDDPNVPTLTVREAGATRTVPAYELKVPEAMLAEVDALLADAEQARAEAAGFPLPRMHVDAHLYAPLLVEAPFTTTAGTMTVPKLAPAAPRVRSTPAGLVDSEVRFLHDLRTTWARRDMAVWGTTELYVLRNLPRTGVGFFETAGFYPDFLVWLKDGVRQVLAFVDPKGLVRWSEEKVALLQTIRELSDQAGFPLLGLIVTPTPAEGFAVPGVGADGLTAHLRSRGVLLQDQAGYAADLLEAARHALAAANEPAPV